MAVNRLLQQIAACNERSIARSGEIDPQEIAKIMALAIDTAPNRHALLLELAEFIGCAMSGMVNVPEPHRKHPS